MLYNLNLEDNAQQRNATRETLIMARGLTTDAPGAQEADGGSQQLAPHTEGQTLGLDLEKTE